MTARAVQIAAERYAKVLGQLQSAEFELAGAKNHQAGVEDSVKYLQDAARSGREALEAAIKDAREDSFIP